MGERHVGARVLPAWRCSGFAGEGSLAGAGNARRRCQDTSWQDTSC